MTSRCEKLLSPEVLNLAIIYLEWHLHTVKTHDQKNRLKLINNSNSKPLSKCCGIEDLADFSLGCSRMYHHIS